MIDNNLNDNLRSGAYVRVLCESGFKEALFGLSLSYRALTPLEINGTKRYFNDDQHFLKLCKIAETLAFKQGGHNKFLDFSIDEMRDSLPSGFLECRVVNTNYKTLQNIIHQRKNHKSKKWNTFIEMLLQQIQHPEFLVNNQGE